MTKLAYSSVECARKPSAEDYPRNFALIRLAERTQERQRKEAEEAKLKQAEEDEERAKQAAAEDEIA